MVISGDLVDFGRPDEYALLATELARLHMPFYLVPGNHDVREHLLATFASHTYLPLNAHAPLDWVVEEHPVRLIGLDTPSVDPATLRRWLAQGHDDEGREVVTLDTRNAFEVDAGTFDNAIDWRIDKFTEFPPALRAHKTELQDKTVVSFCTGGIRCEKAAILMREEGLSHVYQLEGGILKYFELTDGAHYHGGCFVFDERRVLAADLSTDPLPTDSENAINK